MNDMYINNQCIHIGYHSVIYRAISNKVKHYMLGPGKNEVGGKKETTGIGGELRAVRSATRLNRSRAVIGSEHGKDGKNEIMRSDFRTSS